MKKSITLFGSGIFLILLGMRKSNREINTKKHQKIEFPKTNILPPELSNRSFSHDEIK